MECISILGLFQLVLNKKPPDIWNINKRRLFDSLNGTAVPIYAIDQTCVISIASHSLFLSRRIGCKC